MLKRLYNWTLELANRPYAERWLGFIAFIESSVFPIPPDVMLLPMALAKREKAIRFAIICTIGSVLGAMLGYAIGYFAWELVGKEIISFYGYMDEFARFQENFIEWGAWLVFLFGLTFFPFKVITIASGVVAMDPLAFLIASLASRTPRFLIEGFLILHFGEAIQNFIEKRLTLVTSVTVFLLFFGFIAIKYIG
ncbi:MAG: DedA family protein [Sphingomonadales bacterium]|nr:DedA family protein [Sphingomonadales bacterium]